MGSTNPNSESAALGAAWTALIHRVAAGVGAVAALISLIWDASATVASARGAVAWLATVLLGRATRWLLSHTFESRPDRVGQPAELAVTTAEPRETS